MQKYQETVISAIGRPVVGAAVRVATMAGAAATIYSDNGVTPISSLVTDSTGAFGFYAADGRYTITISGAGFPTRVISDVLLEDPVDGSGPLASSDGSALIGFAQVATGAVSRTAQAKLREWVSPEDFGAAGDGIADDTSKVQLALSSGVSELRFTPGKTYIIDGGLTTAIIGQQIIAHGATIKLKANATTKWFLKLNAAGIKVFGGTWDGDKANGNAPASVYDSYAIGVYADRCTVSGCYSINTFGMFVSGGNVNDTLVENNIIRNTTGYGIFLSSTVDAFRNRAVGNNIDMSEGGTFGQGILFTGTAAARQYDWELLGNIVNGSQDAGMASQGINLAVRGHRGMVANNRTKYGAMGFSEGGDGTVVTGNVFSDLVGTSRYGVELSGSNVSVSGNHIRDALRGVTGSAQTMDHTSIAGNTFMSCSRSVDMEVPVGGTARYLAITGNTIKQSAADHAIYLKRDCKYSLISGNNIVGPGSGTAGRAVYLDSVGGFVAITGNRLSGWGRAVGVYDPTAVAYTNLTFNNNDVSNDVAGAWLNIEGSATIGNYCTQIGNVESIGFVKDIVDTANNIIRRYSTGSPEGSVTAGIGSVYYRTNGGASTTMYIKESGAGNTGWIGK